MLSLSVLAAEEQPTVETIWMFMDEDACTIHNTLLTTIHFLLDVCQLQRV